MIESPAFNVRSYPPFRMARIFRLYIDRDALYLIRTGGLIGHADAGSRFELHPVSMLVGMFLRWWAKPSTATTARELDRRGPRELVDAHASNLRIERAEVAESCLSPPRLLGHGAHLASWSLTIRGRRPMTFQIEDEASLGTALEHLPRLLEHALSVAPALEKR